MGKIKLISLDLDGTLLNDRGKIPEENLRILREFVQKDVIIVLSSGRMTDCISPFADILGIDCPLITYNGAMVKKEKSESRKIIYHNPLSFQYGDMLLNYCFQNKFHLNYYLNDTLYALDSLSLKKYSLIYSKQTGAKYNFVKDLKKFKGNSPTKLILITDVFNKDKFRMRDYQYEYFSKKLKNKVNLFKTNPEYLEFLNIGVDKGTALKKLAEFYDIKCENIIAFGDGENDIAMIKFAGIGVALSNAKEKVKKSADVVLKWDNNQAGVAKFLINFQGREPSCFLR